jgi:hypothetical protein
MGRLSLNIFSHKVTKAYDIVQNTVGFHCVWCSSEMFSYMLYMNILDSCNVNFCVLKIVSYDTLALSCPPHEFY